VCVPTEPDRAEAACRSTAKRRLAFEDDLGAGRPGALDVDRGLTGKIPGPIRWSVRGAVRPPLRRADAKRRVYCGRLRGAITPEGRADRTADGARRGASRRDPVAAAAGPNRASGPPSPGIGVPKFDFDVPKFDFDAPKFDFDAPKFDFDAPKFDFGVPKFDFDVPKFDFDAPKFDFGVPKFDFDVPKFDFDAPKFDFGVPKFDFEASYINFWMDYSDVGTPESTLLTAPGSIRVGAAAAA